MDLPHPVTQVAEGGSIWVNGQTLVMLSNGSLRAWGADFHGQLGNGTTGQQASPIRFYLPPGVTYKTLATGSATSYALSVTGQVHAWGVNFAGQVGDGLGLATGQSRSVRRMRARCALSASLRRLNTRSASVPRAARIALSTLVPRSVNSASVARRSS